MRCESKSPQGIQCGFPAGHYGKHGNGSMRPTWDDPQKTVTIMGYSDFIDLDWGRIEDRPVLASIFPKWIMENASANSSLAR